TDENDTPLPGVTVQILNTTWGNITDPSGVFTITEVPYGTYTLSANFTGYNTQIQTIEIQNQAVTINFTLQESTQRLGEVIVSAQKREESLQKTPVAVTTADAPRIEQLQVNGMNEIGRLVPNTFTFDDGPGIFSVVATRGVATIDSNPIVGIYLDGVPIFNTTSFFSTLSDVERIEVLRGPQGTLYGRNSLGGVINITTQSATNETKSFVRAGYGNYNQYELSAGLNTPIIQNRLFMRLSGYTTGREGYIENELLGNSDMHGRSTYGGNLRLAFLPGNRWSYSLISNNEYREAYAFAFLGGFGATSALTDSLKEANPYSVSLNTNGLYKTLSSNNAFKASFSGNTFNFDAVGAFQLTRLIVEDEDVDYSPLVLNTRDFNDDDYTLSGEFRLSSVKEEK
ncbi:MAG: TonB-dependent receptor, partial [Bacteroidota bacterium]